MIPIRDANRSKTTPHITRILIVANILAFIPLLLYTWLGMGGNVAYWAHIGSFVAGIMLSLTAKRKRKSEHAMPYYTEIRI